MIEELRKQIESAIREVLSRGLTLNFCRWHTMSNVYFKSGSEFLIKNSNSSDNYGAVSCDLMGAVMLLAHIEKMEKLPKGEQTNVVSSGWAGCATLLGVDWDWTRGFTAGWDATDQNGKTEINTTLREMYNVEAYDLGVELKEKYGTS